MDDRFLDDLELPRDDRHRVEEHRGKHDPDDAEKARQHPEPNAETAEMNGMLNAMQEMTNAAITPKNAA
jgi:hypothetical protein